MASSNSENAKHVEVAEHNASSDSGSLEKASAPTNQYPISDDDYVVTFKTWIVVRSLFVECRFMS